MLSTGSNFRSSTGRASDAWRAATGKEASGADAPRRGRTNSQTALRSPHVHAPGFTLIEIMIVVGIMGIILTMSVPLVYKVWHRAPMAQALHDVTEVCSNARREAILHGHQVDLVFHGDGRYEVGGGIGGSSIVSPELPVAVAPPARSGYSGRLPENVGLGSIKVG